MKVVLTAATLILALTIVVLTPSPSLAQTPDTSKFDSSKFCIYQDQIYSRGSVICVAKGFSIVCRREGYERPPNLGKSKYFGL